jgi:hypothetical protein
MSFLEHDMTPIDPLSLMPKKGVPKEPVIRKPQYIQPLSPRETPERT